MAKNFILIAVFAFISQFSYSQLSTLTAEVIDTTEHKRVKNAVVALLNPGDSMLVKFIRTDGNGDCKIQDIAAGKYILMVMHPLFADYVEDLELMSGTNTLPPLSVTPKSKLLEAIIL